MAMIVTMRFLGGEFKGRAYETPGVRSTRMMTSKLKKSLFDTLAPYLPGANILDLFAGSGALGLEAISRGAERAYFVDRNASALECIRANVRKFSSLNQSRVIDGDAFRVLENYELSHLDILFLCPPYTFSLEEMERLIDLADERRQIFSDEAIIFFELPKSYKKTFEAKELKNFSIKKTRQVSASFVIYYEVK